MNKSGLQDISDVPVHEFFPGLEIGYIDLSGAISIVYSRSAVAKMLMEWHGMDYEGALEWIDWCPSGPGFPIFMDELG